MQTTFDSPPRFMLPAKLVGFQLKRKPLLPSTYHSCEISPQNCSEKSFMAAAATPEQARVLWTAGKEVTPASLATAPVFPVLMDLVSEGQQRKFSVWKVVIFVVLFCFVYFLGGRGFPTLNAV